MTRPDSFARGETVPWLVHDLLDEQVEITMGDLLKRSDLTRQAIQYHLRKLVETGELEPVGDGRGRRYRRPLITELTLPTPGLQEDRVWRDLRGSAPELEELNDRADRISTYVFTEILNNAIDHSGSDTVRMTIGHSRDRFIFTVADFGVGAFENVRRRLSLEDHIAAIQEISKGKTTTDPTRHTGEGLFFSSKAADWFVLSSNGWKWVVDNVRDDQTIGMSDIRTGTVVRFEIDPRTERELRRIFGAFTNEDNETFDKSRTVVRLFEYDVPFVSRSEAKRLARNLDKFREVIVDFKSIDEVGQGFADELFRVWQNGHPSTKLVPINMNAVVQLMVNRVLPRGNTPA